MNIVFALHVPLTLLIGLWPIWFSVTALRLPWINPLTIAVALALPVQLMKVLAGPLVLLDAGLFDPGYQFALLMTNVYSLAQLLGTLLFFGLARAMKLERYLPFQQLGLGPAIFSKVKWLFLLLFFLALTLLANAEFGIVNWLVNPREGYQLYRTGQGHWFAMAVNCLSIAFLMAVLQRPRPVAILFTALVFVLLAYFLGSKGLLLAIYISALTMLWFAGWKYLPAVVVVGTPVIFGLLVFNLLLALGDAFELLSVIEYFDYFKNAADYYSAYFKGELPLFWGEIFTSSLWAYVPRSLVAEKPFVYGILLVNEHFFPGQAELTNTPAFGGAVEQFADFGVLGVMLGGFFSSQALVTALLSYLIFRKPGVRLSKMTVASTGLLVLHYAPAFGAYLPGFSSLVLLSFVLFTLWLLRGPRRVQRTAVPERELRSG